MLDLFDRAFGEPAFLRSMTTGCPTVPADGGIYAVVLDEPRAEFVAESAGGHFKGKNPTVSVSQLEAKWVEGTSILYVGKTKSLRRRIDQFARFGRGEAIGHWGGRYLWQLAYPNELMVAWRVDGDPTRAEADLISEFVDTFSVLPFANINRPRATGAKS